MHRSFVINIHLFHGGRHSGHGQRYDAKQISENAELPLEHQQKDKKDDDLCNPGGFGRSPVISKQISVNQPCHDLTPFT